MPNKLHQIKITLFGCGENFKCTNHTDPVVNDIDCLNKNGTDLDNEACDIAKVSCPIDSFWSLTLFTSKVI